MIACISSAGIHYEETINTLKYAHRATRIKKTVRSKIFENEL